MVKNKKILPSLPELELVKGGIKQIVNQRGEYLRGVHYGCYLLCSESGLRISEAVKFDLTNKTRKGLYRIEKPKGKKERFVYVSPSTIKELKAQNWQPNQTNRFAFYHFLKKIKRELNISKNIELTPHTFRRAFATYHANSGTPLPILQKLLGHSSIRTTALYWKDIYSDDDPSDILSGKKWLEPKKPEPPTEISMPNQENLPENLKPLTTEPAKETQKPVIKPNSPPIKTEPKSTITSYQPISEIQSITEPNKSKNEITPKSPSLVIENFPPLKKQTELPKTSENFLEQLPVSSKKELNAQEKSLLTKIKELEEQLKQTQTENKNLTAKLTESEATVKQEKTKANHYQQQLKIIAKGLYQQYKINHYKQLEKEQQAKIEQPPKPPWKN